MKILVTNDDGVYSPGLAALARAAAGFGEVRIVAPDVEQSSMGHAVTHSRPLSCRRAVIDAFEAFRVNGTPADCVALGSAQWPGVNVVLSGINLGPNLGHGMWHSGTLAAAKQAALLGMRGIALSAPSTEHESKYERLREPLARILELLLREETSLPLVNVNFPADPRGMVWTRQSVRHYDGHVVDDKDPYGNRLYWSIVKPIEQVEEGTDLWAVRQGLVSVTPLCLDLTDHGALREAREHRPLRDPRGPTAS